MRYYTGQQKLNLHIYLHGLEKSLQNVTLYRYIRCYCNRIAHTRFKLGALQYENCWMQANCCGMEIRNKYYFISSFVIGAVVNFWNRVHSGEHFMKEQVIFHFYCNSIRLNLLCCKNLLRCLRGCFLRQIKMFGGFPPQIVTFC